MKKLYGSFAAKLFAVILLCAMAVVFVLSAAGAATVYARGGYTGSFENMRDSYISNLGDRMLSQVGMAYQEGQLTEQNMHNTVYTGRDAFWFELRDGENQVLLSNYEGGETCWSGIQTFEPHYSLHRMSEEGDIWDSGEIDTEPEVTPTPGPAETLKPENTPKPAEMKTVWVLRDYRNQTSYSFNSEEEAYQWVHENTVTAYGYLPDPLPESFSEARELRTLSLLYTWRNSFLWALGLSFLSGLLLFLFLLGAAGHRKGTDQIVPSFVEKIPFDVFTVGIGLAVCPCLLLLTGGWDWPELVLPLILSVLGFGLLLLLWSMSFAVRVKTNSLRNCLVWRVCCLVGNGCRAVFRNLPILWKWGLGLGLAAIVDLIFRRGAVFSYNRSTFFWFLFWLLAGGATLYAVLAFRRLRRGAEEIANGNMNAKVDEKHLVGDLKDHARDLNHIRDGLSSAVDERMKSERFRTELITNVSHDIKTPLTSIVNYVDLLQKEEPKTEKQQEYLEVLSRQSGKLKKLIEDLIEASKASTGNLSVELQPCDLGILLDQTAGEYGEKLEKAGLELVLQKPETPVTVLADGRHLWRVFDNLLNNVVKYALPGTRVYLSLQEQGRQALVTFRNISREALNISVEELTERFVQGDISRHSDGNGLGLAIAMSLMRLQKGELDIDLDGDLFKVTLRFPVQH
ncbi:MAG: HAMP domain-containing histidine kinase [Oscillospiraceae bacterium]|nr:HAMP domain-containing histidine kinase [Oscillospiraceae bacterium]